MTVLFSITKVEVQNQSQVTGTPFVYAVNEINSWEWGKVCTGTIDVPNFPILKVGGAYPNISFLQVSTWKGQYQLYWNDGNAGEAILLAQCTTTETPYPNNQKNLGTYKNSEPKTFKLVIDLTQDDGFGGMSLVAD